MDFKVHLIITKVTPVFLKQVLDEFMKSLTIKSIALRGSEIKLLVSNIEKKPFMKIFGEFTKKLENRGAKIEGGFYEGKKPEILKR